jgi:hypothetical protein
MDPAPIQAESPKPLEYGRDPGANRRRIIRLTLLLLLGSAAVDSLIKYVPTIWRSTCLYYYERECLAHPIPPGIQVYSSGPLFTAFTSPQTAGLIGQIRPGRLVNSPGSFSPVYIGSRTDWEGKTRCIAIFAFTPTSMYERPYVVYGFELPSRFLFHDYSGSTVIADSGWPDTGSIVFTGPPPVVIYSGVDNQKDKSRFTLTFDVHPRHYVDDCQLLSDGSIQVQEQIFDRVSPRFQIPMTPKSYNTGPLQNK